MHTKLDGYLIAVFGYISMLSISLSFFFFSHFFPIAIKPISNKTRPLVILSFILAIIAIFIPGFVIKDVSLSPWKIITGVGIYIPFGVFLSLMLISFIILIRKVWFAKLKEIERYQAKVLLFGTLTSTILGVIFNLFYPLLLQDYRFVRIGPVFTLILVISVSYAIVRYQTFNLKIIAAQSFTSLLCVFIFARLLLSESLQEQISNAALLIISIIFGVLLIKSVINEVKQREKIEKLAKDLEKANERLKELDVMKTEFLSFATHQLRTPVTAIKGYASEILEGDFGEVSEKAKEPINKIFRSGNSLAVMIEDYLNVSKIEQGKMTYTMTDFELDKLVEEVVDDLRKSMEKEHLAVEVKVAANVMVNADRGKIGQIVSNLVDNAIKYTEEGKIVVTLTKDERTNKALIVVKDTGAGIKPETMAHLFEKFSRASDASKYNLLGTGLGLYLAKKLLEAHHGKIWAESEGAGKGSTFFVELPVV